MLNAAGDQPLRVAQWGRIRWWNACAWYLVTLAEGLERLGHTSLVLAPEGAPLLHEARARGLTCPPVGDLGSAHPGRFVAALRSVERLLEAERVDVVNVHSGAGHAPLAWVCRRLGIPLVRTRGDIRLPRVTPFQRWLYRRATTHHIAAASFLRDAAYPPLGIEAQSVTVLRGGIELGSAIDRTEARRQVRTACAIPDESWVAGMVARLSPVKGHRDVIAAIARLAKSWPELHLVLAGGAAQLSPTDLLATARELEVENRVHLVGRVEDPLRWAAGFDAAIIASTGSEAICRSAFEYLALGVPVIATRINAVAEVVTPEVGMLVEPGDIQGIADALSRLRGDAGLIDALRAAGPRHVEAHYRLEDFAAKTVSVYREAITTVSRGPRGTG